MQQHHQEALEEIKTELCKAQIIIYHDIDPNTTTILQCDASTLGVVAWIRRIKQRCAKKNSKNGINLPHPNRVKVLQNTKRMPGSDIWPTKNEYFLFW